MGMFLARQEFQAFAHRAYNSRNSDSNVAAINNK
jgi:hypothetical protein